MLGKSSLVIFIYLCLSLLSISMVSSKENASLHFNFDTLHQFQNESTTAMARVIFLITIKMCFFFQSEEIFLDMFEDEYTQMIVSNY